MKEYKLKKWYPSLVIKWKNTEFPIVVVKRENSEYRLHPSLKNMTRLATISEREVENNPEFWEELVPEKSAKEVEEKNYSIKDIVPIVNNWAMSPCIDEDDILNFLAKNEK